MEIRKFSPSTRATTSIAVLMVGLCEPTAYSLQKDIVQILRQCGKPGATQLGERGISGEN